MSVRAPAVLSMVLLLTGAATLAHPPDRTTLADERREPGLLRPVRAWTASLVSGKGPEGLDPTSIALVQPSGVALGSDGSLYVADRRGYRVLRVLPSGPITRFAGTGERCTDDDGAACGDGGPATSARFGEIGGIAIDSWGHVYVSDTQRDRVRRIDAATGTVETVVNTDGVECAEPAAPVACGDGGTAGAADLDGPEGLAFDSQDRLYVADTRDSRLRRIAPHFSTGSVEPLSTIETVVGNGVICLGAASCGDGGPALAAEISPKDVAVYEDGPQIRVYVSDVGGSDRVREATIGGNIEAFAGLPGLGGSLEDCSDPNAYNLQGPRGVEVDADGNVYIADGTSGGILRVDATNGLLCRIAGYGSAPFEGGPGCDSRFGSPIDLFLDRNTNDLFIADARLNHVRKLAARDSTIYECRDPDSVDNLIHTVVGSGSPAFSGEGSPATAAPIGASTGLAIDGDGNILIGDAGADRKRVRRVDAATGVMTTIAGNGFGGTQGDHGEDAMAAGFNLPYDLVVDGNGNVFVADRSNDMIRKITPNGKIWTVAGKAHDDGFDGDTPRLAVEARLNDPQFLAVDGDNNVYLSSRSNRRVRRIDAVGGEVDPASSTITTVAGGGASTDYDNAAGVPIEEIRLSPTGLAISEDNTLYVGNRSGTGAYRVFAIPEAHTANVQNTGMHFVHSFAGSAERCPSAGSGFHACGDGGPASAAMLGSPAGLAHDPATGDLYVGDSLTRRLRRIWNNGGEWQIEGVAGSSAGRFFGDGGPAVDAGLNYPSSVAVDAAGNVLFSDFYNNAVRRVDAGSGIITTVAGAVFPYGDRELEASNLAAPHALVRKSATEWLVADGWSQRVRSVDPTPGTGSVSTVAGYPAGFTGDDVPALYSRMLDNATGIAWDGRRYVYVAETDNHVIRRIDTARPPWTIEHWAGTEGAPGLLNRPGGLAIDEARSLLYVADTGNHVVRSIDLANPNQIAVVAGVVGEEGSCATDTGDATGVPGTRLRAPVALAKDSSRNDSLFVVDAGCHMVRRIDLSGVRRQSTRVIGDGTDGDPGDGIASSVRLWEPRGATVDGAGNLFVTSRAHVLVVSAGTNRRADEGDRVEVIYGADPNGDKLQSLTRCLTGVAVAEPVKGPAKEVYALDRCAGFMLRLRRE